VCPGKQGKKLPTVKRDCGRELGMMQEKIREVAVAKVLGISNRPP
jgi:hypothetical protein